MTRAGLDIVARLGGFHALMGYLGASQRERERERGSEGGRERDRERQREIERDRERQREVCH